MEHLQAHVLNIKHFVICVNKSKENVLDKFVSDVVLFACGCLNKRQNGIIYFGVADINLERNMFEYYKHGEIVGFRVDEIG